MNVLFFGTTMKQIRNIHNLANDLNSLGTFTTNDGGVNISYDQGENWIKLNQPSVGQFYAINVDNSEPYNVYGGLQDNGVLISERQVGPVYRGVCHLPRQRASSL
mgnify:CR=1 FL=1